MSNDSESIVEAVAQRLAAVPKFSAWDDYEWEDIPAPIREEFLADARALIPLITQLRGSGECICPKCGIRHGSREAGDVSF